MPIRDVMIRLGLNAAPFVAGIKEAQLASTGLAGNLTKTAATGSKSAAVLGSSFGMVGITVGLAGAQMIKAAADFDQGMSNVKATGADAAKNIGALREAAIEAGAATKYSATEAAAGIEELEKAGLNAKDVLGGGLKGALNLAAAGNIEVAEAANITATALQQFGLQGTEATHVSDLLAAAAGKAQGEVGDFAYALKYAGVPAKSLGVSIEETTGALAMFASKGILGEQAGTNLRSIMLSLAAPTSAAKSVMDQYGLSLYDSKGKFVGLSSAAQQLHTRLGGLSEAERNTALSNIFGQNAIQGAITLYEGGSASVDKWTGAVNDAGYAADVAREKNNNLRGDLEQLKGSLDTLLIKGGGGSQGPLRVLAQTLTEITNTLGTRDSKFDLTNLFDKDETKSRLLHRLGKDRASSNSGSSASADRQIKLTADISDITKQGNVADKIIDNVLQDRPTAVKADPKPAVAAAKQADKAIDGVKQNSVPKIDADASAAINAASAAQRAINNVLGGLANIGRAHGGAIERANGGQISGPGTGTSDSIPAMLSNGEHVLTASDVRKVGGQDAVYRLRAGIQAGALSFASGGPVGMTSNQWALAIAQLQADMADNRSQLKTAKGTAARRVLQLEYNESKVALRRLKGGLSSDFDFGLQSILDARNEPVSLFGGFSDSPWMRSGGFASQAQQKLSQIKTLAGKLIELRKRGLAGGLIAEIAEMGSGQGIAAADALLKSPGEIKQLSTAYSQYQGYQGVIAAAAYQPPYAGGGVQVSIKGISFNLKKMSAEFDAVITDKAGKILDRQHFNSTVN